MQQRRQERLSQALRAELPPLLHQALLEAMTPLAQALHRQDSLLLDRTEPLQALLTEQQALLLELLQASQPSSRQQLEQALGLSTPR
jgi:hypothetical protein